LENRGTQAQRLILLNLFSFKHTMWRVLWWAWLSLWICMQLVASYLPIGNLIEHFTMQQLRLSIWISDRVTSSSLEQIFLYLLTYPPINPTKTNCEWFDRMNIKDEQCNGWGHNVIGSECTQYP
jgi:hypothetical protein